MQFVASGVETLCGIVQKPGLYLMLVILLPGGTLFALLVFLYQRRKLNAGSNAPRSALAAART